MLGYLGLSIYEKQNLEMKSTLVDPIYTSYAPFIYFFVDKAPCSLESTPNSIHIDIYKNHHFKHASRHVD